MRNSFLTLSILTLFISQNNLIKSMEVPINLGTLTSVVLWGKVDGVKNLINEENKNNIRAVIYKKSSFQMSILEGLVDSIVRKKKQILELESKYKPGHTLFKDIEKRIILENRIDQLVQIFEYLCSLELIKSFIQGEAGEEFRAMVKNDDELVQILKSIGIDVE